MDQIKTVDDMLLPVFHWQRRSNYSFVHIWSHYYEDPNDNKYSSPIKKKQFTDSDVKELFIWKNGMPLSELKEKRLRQIQEKLAIINGLKTHFSIEEFKSQFENLSSIWKIFLLHVINPMKYPIFDQHVCRAYYFITCNEAWHIPISSQDAENIYFIQYVDFFNMLAEGIGMTNTITERKKVGEALWEFGKFLKTPYGNKMSYTYLKAAFKRQI